MYAVVASAVIFSLISSFLFVVGNVFSLYAFAENVPLMQMLMVRWLTLGAFSLAISWREMRAKPCNALGEPGQRCALFTLAVFRAANSLLWLFGVGLIPIIEANSLIYAFPVMSAVTGHFVLHERLSLRASCFLVVAVVGVVLIVQPWTMSTGSTADWEHAVGATASLGAAGCNVVTQILTRKRQDLSPIVISSSFTIYSVLLCAVVMNLVAFVGYQHSVFMSPMAPLGVGYILGYASFSAAAQYLEVVSQQRGDVLTMAVLGYAEPFFTVFAQLFVLQRPILPVVGVGCACIVLSGLGVTLLRPRRRIEPVQDIPQETTLETTTVASMQLTPALPDASTATTQHPPTMQDPTNSRASHNAEQTTADSTETPTTSEQETAPQLDSATPDRGPEDAAANAQVQTALEIKTH